MAYTKTSVFIGRDWDSEISPDLCKWLENLEIPDTPESTGAIEVTQFPFWKIITPLWEIYLTKTWGPIIVGKF